VFRDVDEVIAELLKRDMPIKKNEIDLDFHQPVREWSGRLSRPTLNIFLYGIEENVRLRHSEVWYTEKRDDGTAVMRRSPARVDLHYLITAWANDPQDEHTLLARALMVLMQSPCFPEELLPPSLSDQKNPIPLQVAQSVGPAHLGEHSRIWNALDNEARPAISLTVTIALDPYKPLTAPLVRSREIRFRRTDEIATQPDVFWTLGGTVTGIKEEQGVTVRDARTGVASDLVEGRFAIGGLRAGAVELEVVRDDQVIASSRAEVPGPDVTIHI